ncbi:MAG: polysaccharide ABC transporter ATP-binding protein [Gemmataceae bacterium]
MPPAIRVSNLSKLYHLGARSPGGYRTLRESLMNAAAAPFRRRDHAPANQLWALKDVEFEINPGEVVGIIGRNGAGKSTLLKILSRVTEPTTGRVEIRGRLGSLLEVGTGFHLELTGSENIYLNGAILGMTRREIARRFDDIVNFAEIEAFLETPVKRYSSGMYVRLAFAIAAHLEPEILIIDEVLAVGDAAFQNKCISKTQEVARGGRTILLVSHQMDVVRRLCQKAVLLKHGQVRAAGDTADVINQYLAEGAGRVLPGVPVETLRITPRGGNLDAVFTRVTCTSGSPLANGQPFSDGPLRVELEVECRRPLKFNSLSVSLFDRSRTRLVNADTLTLGRPPVALEPGTHEFVVRIPRVHLRPGLYLLGACLANRPVSVFDNCESIGEIEVVAAPGREDQPRPGFDAPVACDVEWLS